LAHEANSNGFTMAKFSSTALIVARYFDFSHHMEFEYFYKPKDGHE